MTNQEVYERGVKIHKQMEEYLKTHSVEVYTEGETKLYKKGLEYSQPDYIWNGKGCYYD
jgi:hypothetical protein